MATKTPPKKRVKPPCVDGTQAHHFVYESYPVEGRYSGICIRGCQVQDFPPSRPVEDWNNTPETSRPRREYDRRLAEER